MGGDKRTDEFEGGGGTFRDRNVDPKMYVMPLDTTNSSPGAKHLGDMYGRNLLEDPKKIYDYEALKRLLELLNKDRERKPHGVPDNASIGF